MPTTRIPFSASMRSGVSCFCACNVGRGNTLSVQLPPPLGC